MWQAVRQFFTYEMAAGCPLSAAAANAPSAAVQRLRPSTALTGHEIQSTTGNAAVIGYNCTQCPLSTLTERVYHETTSSQIPAHRLSQLICLDYLAVQLVMARSSRCPARCRLGIGAAY